LVKLYAEEFHAAKKKAGSKTSKTKRNHLIHLEFKQKNEKLIKLLKKSTTKATSKTTADEIFKALSTNEVSKVGAVGKYDIRGDVGFCFGRATMVHYLLLKKGIKQSQIAKIFALGNLRYRKRFWEFHMATLVKGTGNWWVIDSLFEKVMSHEQWIKRVAAFDPQKNRSQVRFYTTDARKFQPQYPKYASETFKHPLIKKYFEALFASLNPQVPPVSQ